MTRTRLARRPVSFVRGNRAAPGGLEGDETEIFTAVRRLLVGGYLDSLRLAMRMHNPELRATAAAALASHPERLTAGDQRAIA